MSETTYMLVVPPVGEIERIEFPRSENEGFERIKQEASVRAGKSAFVTELYKSRLGNDVLVYVDEDAGMYADGPGVDLRPNPRMSWAIGGYWNGLAVGPVVVCGGDRNTTVGLSLDRAVELTKILDGAV